ncbi:hypothetical protein D3C76_901420 [compost metagenome]
MFAAVFAAQGVYVQLQAEVIGEVATGAQVGVPQLTTTGVERGLLLQRGFPFVRDRLTDEVDHPADVVRTVLHRCSPTHDVDTVDGGHGHREQRQAGLAIGCQCQWNTVRQSLDTAAAALVQAAYGNLRQGPGAGFIEDLDPWHMLQRIVQAAVAGLFQVGRIDHAAATGVGAYVLVAGSTEHVALNHHWCQ